MAEIKKSYSIKGMHCASCVRVTERALKKVPGVKEAVVNLATAKAMVTYDANNCTPLFPLISYSLEKLLTFHF